MVCYFDFGFDRLFGCDFRRHVGHAGCLDIGCAIRNIRPTYLKTCAFSC
jgi:hypothetical protein